MNKKNLGFTLVEIIILVAIVVMLAVIAIPNFSRARVIANESNAQATLRTIATACKTFADANNGNYPGSEAALTGATPPYLNRSYNGVILQGYAFALNLTTAGYTITATPDTCGATGKNTLTITTGGVLKQEACS